MTFCHIPKIFGTFKRKMYNLYVLTSVCLFLSGFGLKCQA